MGKKVNLYGCTLAEKLIAFEGAINDLYSLLGDLGFYVTKEGFNSEATVYNVQHITQPIGDNSFLGRPIYFINNSIVAYIATYNSATGEFTVNGSQIVRGPRGEQGIQGEPGINGINGANGRGITSVTDIKDSQENGYTVSTLRIDYTEGDFDQVEIRAKNGNTIPTPVVEITDVPSSATQGTLTTEQLSVLQSSPLSPIKFNNEFYYPMDTMQTEGYSTYVHNGYDNGGAAFAEKAIVLTLSTRAWVLVVKEPIKKMYRHQITLNNSVAKVYFSLFTADAEPYKGSSIVYMLQGGQYLECSGFLKSNNSVVVGIFVTLSFPSGRMEGTIHLDTPSGDTIASFSGTSSADAVFIDRVIA